MSKNNKPQNAAAENRPEGCGEGAAAENSEMMIRMMMIIYNWNKLSSASSCKCTKNLQINGVLGIDFSGRHATRGTRINMRTSTLSSIKKVRNT